MKNTIKFESVLLLLIILVPLTNSFTVNAAEDFQVRNLHLSWQHDVASTITMSWRTKTTTESIVQYGLDENIIEEEIGITGVWHHVELTDLTPATLYYYRVGNGEIWSENYTFVSGHHYSSTKFVTLGDSQGNTPECSWVADQVARIPMDFMMFSGDFVEEALAAEEYYTWFNNYKQIVTDTATITTLGNHEKNSSNYYTMWALPGNEEYYSIDYGPIHIVTLHTYYEGYEDQGGDYEDQASWLISDLEANQDANWTIVMMHRPPFSSFPRNYEPSNWYALINATFTPIFEQYNVDLVVTGHEHGYERLYKNNITYIISGGAGSRLYSPVPEQILNESVYQETYYNFLYLEVDENKFDVRAFRPDYSFMDQYYVNMVSKPDLSFISVPRIYHQNQGDTINIDITVKNTGEENISTSTTLAYRDLDTVQLIEIPALNVGENYTLSYSWSLNELDQRSFRFELDYDSEIDEVTENNNLLEIKILKIAEESTPTPTPTPTTESTYFSLLGCLLGLLSVMLSIVIKQRKKD